MYSSRIISLKETEKHVHAQNGKQDFLGRSAREEVRVEFRS
jgi:hypothetical protein